MYKTEVLSLEIAGKKYSINQVTNVDEVFDRLIHTSSDDINVTDERIPYWTEIWPSALGLSRFIIEHNLSFHSKNMIELGSGLALPSIVAAEYCNEITISDYLDDALDFAKENVKLSENNNVKFSIIDWRNINVDTKYDIVLASDIAYEKRSFEFIPKSIEALLNEDGVCYISEPSRAMAKDFFETVMPTFFSCKKIETYEIEWRGVLTQVGIYEIMNYEL